MEDYIEEDRKMCECGNDIFKLCEKGWILAWKCIKCGKRTYMGPYPTKCDDCDNIKDWVKDC